MKTDKIKQLQERLKTLQNSLPTKDTLSLAEQIISEKYADVTSKVKEDSSLKYLDTINSKLEKFKEDFKLEPILTAVEDMRSLIQEIQSSMTDELEKNNQETELTKKELTNLISNTKNDLEGMTNKELSVLLEKISSLEEQLNFQTDVSSKQGQTLKTVLADLETKLDTLSKKSLKSLEDYGTIATSVDKKFGESDKSVKGLAEALDKLRKDLFSRISNIGGGNANRNIAIGGNSSVLSRYTDLNIKAGTNVTLSYSNNDTSKYLDLTIAATGGGSGLVRSIATTTVSSVVGAAAATDYVVLANGGIKITLPTAVSNTNLYTVKNIGTSSVLVATASSQTIDGSTTITMPVQYTAVDLVSDDTNWHVT